MKIRLNELKGKMADRGQKVSLDDIAAGTGLDTITVRNIANNRFKTLRPEYIDALCAFFGVTPSDLIELESVSLPLSLNIRPDRKGARVGDKTKQKTADPKG